MTNKVHCIILAGNDEFPGGTKNAGPYRVATELRQAGFNVVVLDISIFESFDKQIESILDLLISEETLWVGISTTFLYKIFGYSFIIKKENYDKFDARIPDFDKEIRKFVSFVKSKNSKIKLISGGTRQFYLERYGFQQFTSYCDKEILEYTNWRAGKATSINLEFYGPKINGTEFDRFVTSQIQYEDEDYILPEDSLPIEISRGCIFKCKFCSYPLNGKTKGEWIKRPEVLREEMQRNYDKFGVTSYIFSDDTYNDSLDKVRMLHDEVYSKLNFKIKFATYIRLDLIMRFPEMAHILRDSGLKSAIFGVETLNHASGKIIGKGVDPKKQFEFIWKMKREMGWDNILTSSGFILGLPGDYPGYDKDLQNFLLSNENPLDSWFVHPLFIVPPDKQDKTYFSEFDLEYDKWGYEIDPNVAIDSPAAHWKNDKIGTDYETELRNARRIMSLSSWDSKYKFGAWNYADMISLGCSPEDTAKMNVYDLSNKYSIKNLREHRKQRYIKYIMRKYGGNTNQP